MPRRGGGSRGIKFDRERLGALVDQNTDATLVELRDRLGMDVTSWSICQTLRTLGLTF